MESAGNKIANGRDERSIIPPELVEAAVQAEAQADAATLARSVRLGPGALRHLLADFAAGQAEAIETVKAVAEGAIPEQRREIYYSTLASAGEAVAAILERYPDRHG